MLGGLVEAAHPQPSAAVTAITALLGVRAGLPAPRLMLLVAAVGVGQLSIGWLNDWVDAGRDTAAGRIEKPVVAGAVSRAAVGGSAVAAAAVCVAISALLGPAGAVNLATVASGWVYDLWAKATRASVVPYIISFGLLPAVVTLAATPPRWPPVWMVAAAALLGVGGHFANAVPDLEADRRATVRGLPQRLGARRARRVAAAALATGVTVVAAALPATAAAGVLAVGSVLLAAIIISGARGRDRRAFRLTMVLAVVAVAALLLARP